MQCVHTCMYMYNVPTVELFSMVQAFAEKLGLLVKGITEVVPIKNLTFIMDVCRWLFQCHKVCHGCHGILCLFCTVRLITIMYFN